MGRRKYKPDTEVVDDALTAIEDPYAVRELLVNAPVSGTLDERLEFASQTLRPEITRLFRLGIWDYVQAGRYLKAAETLIGRGKKEDDPYQSWVDESGWNEDFVRCSVKFADVVARFPEAINLPPGLGVRRMLYWSADKIENFLRNEIGEDRLQSLTPQKLLDVYRKKVEETRAEKRERERREAAQRLRRKREKRIAKGLPPDPPPRTPFEVALIRFHARYDLLEEEVKRLIDVLEHGLAEKDIEKVYAEETRAVITARLTDLAGEIDNAKGWPPRRETPFELPEHLKERFS